jgi:hypothetical protein
MENDVPGRRKPLTERFWEKVDKSAGQRGCWLWTGATGNFGYGVIGRGRRNDGVARAHVLSYEWAHGALAAGMVVCHACDTPACVRPDHLFAAPQLANIADMNRKGRGVPPPTGAGENNPAARLDYLDVALVRTLLDHGLSHRRVARELCVTKSTVTRIANNRAWVPPMQEAV